jgi:hypothetical protein
MDAPAAAPSPGFDVTAALAELPRATLEAMLAAGEEALNCQRVLKKTSSNIVADILRHQGTFYEWNHYPKGDAIDWETHSQYYYHAHPKDLRPGEHGHFHTFMRYGGMPEGMEPVPLDIPQKTNENRIGAHLVAVSMDKKGYVTKLFTVNRWVTDETFYPAHQVARMLENFEMDHAHPSWPTNRWLTAVMILFRPQIRHLLAERDVCLDRWKADHPDIDHFEDRELEVTSEMDVNLNAQIDAVKAALG